MESKHCHFGPKRVIGTSTANSLHAEVDVKLTAFFFSIGGNSVVRAADLAWGKVAGQGDPTLAASLGLSLASGSLIYREVADWGPSTELHPLSLFARLKNILPGVTN
ncbi:hypothetical protein CRG98_015673 [Punica granatum]|uniref:Uncharacterized protein n=1 Tax=Punica granatum TaxID=22663 RepID=A0A2I0K5X7_PUNGR|nr:hypothetical protein CRG98_015673 [Punica granatum]